MKGRADNLGGGVFKKRLNKNMHRRILFAEGRRYWICDYLSAKKVRANIDHDMLTEFRILVKGFATLSDQQIARVLEDKDLTAICDGKET